MKVAYCFSDFGQKRQKIPFADAYVMVQSATAANGGTAAITYGSPIGASICLSQDNPYKRLTLVYLDPWKGVINNNNYKLESIMYTTLVRTNFLSPFLQLYFSSAPIKALVTVSRAALPSFAASLAADS